MTRSFIIAKFITKKIYKLGKRGEKGKKQHPGARNTREDRNTRKSPPKQFLLPRPLRSCSKDRETLLTASSKF